MISLGGGLPSSEYFPFGQMDIQVPAVAQLPESTMHIGMNDVREGKSAFDASIALNYGQATGSAQILRWITEHTEV
jgi:aromatic amino acid aminotransferase I